VNGLLVKVGSVEGWVEAFERLLDDQELLPRLRSGIAMPRSMKTAADEILAIYEKVLAEEGHGP
jgi:glycosyltransferase involved in cell wall biosynthesis